MLEKSFQIQFRHFAKEHVTESSVFELKSVKGSSCPFSAVASHQLDALWHSKHRKLFFKIPDGGYSPSPFDCFLISQVKAYVVIRYGSGNFYLIDVDDFLHEMKTSNRKSLTENRAKLIHTPLANS